MKLDNWNFESRKTVEQVEEGNELAPKFDESGLIPCITRHAESQEILMFAFMNDEALKLSVNTMLAHYCLDRDRRYGKKERLQGCAKRFSEF